MVGAPRRRPFRRARQHAAAQIHSRAAAQGRRLPSEGPPTCVYTGSSGFGLFAFFILLHQLEVSFIEAMQRHETANKGSRGAPTVKRPVCWGGQQAAVAQVGAQVVKVQTGSGKQSDTGRCPIQPLDQIYGPEPGRPRSCECV